jgi:hypothetical protein
VTRSDGGNGIATNGHIHDEVIALMTDWTAPLKQ